MSWAGNVFGGACLSQYSLDDEYTPEINEKVWQGEGDSIGDGTPNGEEEEEASVEQED